MKTSTLLWLSAAFVAVVLVSPSSARPKPGSFEAKQSAQSTSAQSSAASAKEEEVSIKNGCGGSYDKKSSSSNQAAASASSSSSSKSVKSTTDGASGGSSSSAKGSCGCLTKEEIQKKYTKLACESEETYYSRIVKKESSEDNEYYIKRIKLITEVFPTLGLWYDYNYFKYTSEAWKVVYARQSNECDVDYFKRLLKKQELCDKSTDIFAKRIYVLAETFPTLTLWSDEKYFDIVKEFYTAYYDRKTCSSDEEYAKKIFTKDTLLDTSDKTFYNRLHLVQMATATQKIWYDESFYEKYTKSFYTSYYKKVESQTAEAWFGNVAKLLPGETNEIAIKRLTLIKKSGCCSECWSEATIAKLESCGSFKKEYIELIKKTFCTASYSKKSTSSSTSAKSASAQQSSSEVVVKGGGCS